MQINFLFTIKMNKAGFLICFLLFINFSQQLESDISSLYDKFVLVCQGLADSNQHKCSNALNQNKAGILPKVEQLVTNIQNGQDMMTAMASFGISLLSYSDVMSNCQILGLVKKITDLATASKIAEMGGIMQNKSTEIESLISQIKNASSEDQKLVIIGQLIRMVTGISVK